MNKYKNGTEEFERLVGQAKNSDKPVITAIQKKKRRGKLRPWQIDIMKSLKFLKTVDIIFSLKKKRPESGDPIVMHMDYNGTRLIPLNKNK